MNISSIVVQTLPKYLDEVVENLKSCEACDYHFMMKKGESLLQLKEKVLAKSLESYTLYKKSIM